MKSIKLERTSEIAVLLILRAIIYGSILALFFVFTYMLFDMLGIGNSKANLADKPVEDAVAAFGNDDSSQFARGLSGTFARSPSIVGAVDFVKRSPDGRLELAGWAVDKSDPQVPILVFVVVPKKAVLMTNTGKKRDEVARMLSLPADTLVAGFSDTFDYKFDCKDSNLRPFVVAVSQKKQFSVIQPLVQVGGC